MQASLSRNILFDISSPKQAASSRSAAEVKIRPSSPNWFSGEIDFCLCNCCEGPSCLSPKGSRPSRWILFLATMEYILHLFERKTPQGAWR